MSSSSRLSQLALPDAAGLIPPRPETEQVPQGLAATLAALPVAVPHAFVSEVLSPYRNNAKYLTSAAVTAVRDPAAGTAGPLLTARGRFTIPESCYIDDTGHFNAVEFNICYNQLAYVVFGHCIAAGVLAELIPAWNQRVQLSYADYRRHQLPSMLIAKLEGRFSKQLRSDDFVGELSLDRVTVAGRASFCFTTITFGNGDEVKSRGSVVLAFSPGQAADGG